MKEHGDITFSKVLFRRDTRGYLNLLFVDKKNDVVLSFDGLYFDYTPQQAIAKDFEDLEYSVDSRQTFAIDSIRTDSFLSFIKLSNGDIFQIYFMPDGSDLQRLQIFRQSDTVVIPHLGITIYEEAVKRFERAEDDEIPDEQ